MQEQISNEYPWQPQILDSHDEEAPIDLLEVFYIFWGHLRQIVLWLVIGAAAGVLCTLVIRSQEEPQYQAISEVYVAPAENDISDVMTILSNLSDDDILLADVVSVIKGWQCLPNDASMIADYKALLVSRPLLQDVIEALSLETSPATLENMITVDELEGTHIVKIAVTSSNAQQAIDIANELVSQGKLYFRDFVKTEPPKLLEKAETSSVRHYANDFGYLRNAALGGLLAAVLYCAFLFVNYLKNNTIVTPEDIQECFGVEPLGTIPISNQGSTQQHNSGNMVGERKA